MMQPMDIKSHSFGTGLFGYKKGDVDQYVDTVYRAYDELFTENKNLREEKDKLNKVIEENRVKLFEYENKAGGGSVDISDAEAEKERIIAEARKTAAEIINAAKNQGDKIASASDTFEEIKSDDKKDSSATSKFFQDSSNDIFGGGDDDDVFVGEIEDNRKTKNKVMIGDGEEEGADDFEFL